MTKDEALKQALEALENHCGNYKLDDAGCDRHDKAITAIKEALGECDEDELIIQYHEATIKRLENRIDELMAQPEQEPVGYVYSEAGLKSAAIQRDLPNGTPLYAAPLLAQEPSAIPIGYWHYGTGAFFKGAYLTPAQEQMRKSGALKRVYTAPPQRPWLGLTEEDRLCAKYMQDAPDGIEAVIDYIEAKLKEKNT